MTANTSSIPAELKLFLQPTKNYQSTDSRIITLYNTILNGITDPLTKAIFNYIKDKYGYIFYYNTEYGAI